MKDLIIAHSDSYANWIFDPDHPTQGRRFTNGYNALIMHIESEGLTHETREPIPALRKYLETVHTPAYVTEILSQHISDEWVGVRPDMAHLAALFVGGTQLALNALRNNETLTAVNLPGAKHHAATDHSSGFCVFADFVLAAKELRADGKKVAILDVDAHHGDGTENLCFKDSGILTYSIHEYGIFPGTGLNDHVKENVYNWPLTGKDGDRALLQGVNDFLDVAAGFKPDYIFVVGGADGHRLDPLSDLKYTISGLERAMVMVRDSYPVTPILFGGAGGYQPDGATPLVWARMVTALAR